MSDRHPPEGMGSPNDRGFIHGEEIPSLDGGYIKVVESSLATQAAIRVFSVCPVNLNRPEGPVKEASIHLALEDAVRFRDQLNWLIDNHYQAEPPGPHKSWVCGFDAELLYLNPDGEPCHASRNCGEGPLASRLCAAPELVPAGRCMDCGVMVDETSDDPAVQGCYANRGFDHVRVVGR